MKLRFGPYTVETSNDDKPLFPQDGITKAAIAGYYRDVAELMLPHLEDRCLTIRRFPEGIDKDGFFQQHRPAHFPDFVGSASLPTAAGARIDLRVHAQMRDVEAVAEGGALFPHVNVYMLEWLNPHPDKEIAAIDMLASDSGVPILLGITAGEHKDKRRK